MPSPREGETRSRVPGALREKFGSLFSTATAAKESIKEKIEKAKGKARGTPIKAFLTGKAPEGEASWVSNFTPESTPRGFSTRASTSCGTSGRCSESSRPDGPYVPEPSFCLESVDSTPTTWGTSILSCASASPLRTPQLSFCPKQQVYYLYSSPMDWQQINVRAEVQEIHTSLVDSKSRTKLNVGVATWDSFTKFLTLARTQKGAVLHLSAHSMRNEQGELSLVLEDKNGTSHRLSKDKLEVLLGLEDRRLENLSLLFLSTCWSQELAQVFVECGCPHVICLREPVRDDTARRFAKLFYLSLGAGDSVLQAWEGARKALGEVKETAIAKEAEHFMLFGHHGAAQARLEDLCGNGPCMDDTMRELEDAAHFLETTDKIRSEHFTGRILEMQEILRNITGHDCLRAYAIHGAKGSGKSALGKEFARFYNNPGRAFSCSARILSLPDWDVARIVESLHELLDGLADREAYFRPGSFDSRSSLCSWGHSSVRSGTSTPYEADLDPAALHLRRHQLLRKRLQQLSFGRKDMPFLLVIDDEVGALSHKAVQDFFGEVLKLWPDLSLLILTQLPSLRTLGEWKVASLSLKGLAPKDAANLLIRRIHRRLETRDFPTTSTAGSDGGEEQTPSELWASKEGAIKHLAGHALHPLLESLAGHPGKIRQVATKVIPEGPSLMELAKEMAVATPRGKFHGAVVQG